MNAQKVEFPKRVEQGRAAMTNVVIPYFKKLVDMFPEGEFKFNPAAMKDHTHAAVAVSFKIGNGAEHVIEVFQGNVRIYRKAPKARLARIDVQFTYSGDAEPFIAGPSDLTSDKLSKLVEMAINELALRVR